MSIPTHAVLAHRVAVVVALLVAIALIVAAGGVSFAQEDGGAAPDVTQTQRVFLPAIALGRPPIPNQYIVVMAHPEVRSAAAPDGRAISALELAQNTVETYGGEVLYVYDVALEGFAAIMSPEAVATLSADPNVAYVEPDQVMSTIGTQSPATWGLDRIDQRDLPLSDSYIDNATGAGVHAYIIDTGIRATHQQFAGRIGNGYTAINDGRGSADCNGHGTHVAGTVGGSTYGVAKQATLHPVRVLDCNGSGTTSGVIAGVNWVTANRVRPAVANMSLGGGASSSLDTAVRNSISAGVVYALAAGNESADACSSSPARTAEALTVGATTNTDARASYSNFGACLDLFAPGSSITSAYYSSDAATATMSGTSMASPHVAGAAVLYLSVYPSTAPSEVMAALVNNTTPDKVASPGSGSPNKLLYTGFIGSAPSPTTTATNTPTTTPVTPPTATATNTPTTTPVTPPTATATSTPTNTPVTPPTATATNTPATTPVTQPTVTPTLTPTATPVPPGNCTNFAQNPGFENGRMVWAESSVKGYVLICTATSCGAGVAPRTGTYLGWLGGADRETAELRQNLTLPAGKVYLTFWYQIDSTDYCGYDKAYAQLKVGSSTKTLKTFNLCTTTDSPTWVRSQIDVSSYAGRAVTLIIRAKTDSSLVSSFFVDDAAITNSSTCAAAQSVIETPEDVEFLENAVNLENPAPKPDVAAPAADAQR